MLKFLNSCVLTVAVQDILLAPANVKAKTKGDILMDRTSVWLAAAIATVLAVWFLVRLIGDY